MTASGFQSFAAGPSGYSRLGVGSTETVFILLLYFTCESYGFAEDANIV